MLCDLSKITNELKQSTDVTIIPHPIIKKDRKVSYLRRKGAEICRKHPKYILFRKNTMNLNVSDFFFF
jgi:hypothetical protein